MKTKENLVKNLRRLLETEVSQAEVMMAAKDFANELQEMIEKIGRLQNEDLPPVTDKMRETYDTQSASAFQTKIYGAFQSVMDALYTAKDEVDDAVTNLAQTGTVTAQIDMEKEPMGAEPEMAPGAEMGAEEPVAAPGEEGAEMGPEEEPLGRAQKVESVQTLKNKVIEMRRLVARAKKLKEMKNQ